MSSVFLPGEFWTLRQSNSGPPGATEFENTNRVLDHLRATASQLLAQFMRCLKHKVIWGSPDSVGTQSK